MKWIDIHCHLEMLEISPEEAIQNAKDAGLEHLFTISSAPEDIDPIFALAQKHNPFIYCTMGIHPHYADAYTDEIEKKVESHLNSPLVVAVGEIGLDYYYKHADIDNQHSSFRKQLELSKKYNLPIEIHTRDAEEDTVRILKEVAPNWKGVVHCFTGTDYLAEEALALGLNISISGISTFKNAEALRATLKKVPLDRIHVETDSPYLAPVPMRGRKNQPAYVVHTAQFLAEMYEVDLVYFNQQVQENTKKLFLSRS